MAKEIAWIDKDYKQYTMDQIEERHLLNIIHMLCRGGGYMSFLTQDRIYRLFKEAERRRLRYTGTFRAAIIMYKERKELQREEYLLNDFYENENMF